MKVLRTLIVTLMVTLSTNAMPQDFNHSGFSIPSKEEIEAQENTSLRDDIKKYLTKNGYSLNWKVFGAYKMSSGERNQFEMLPLEPYVFGITSKMTLSNALLVQNGLNIKWNPYVASLICGKDIFIFEMQTPNQLEKIMKEIPKGQCRLPDPNLY